MQLRQCGVAKAAGWLPAAAEGRFIAASFIPVPSQPEGSLVHPRELLDPTAQGHAFVQCSVSLPGPVTTQCIPMTNNLWGRAVQSSVIGIGNSFKYGNVLICCVRTRVVMKAPLCSFVSSMSKVSSCTTERRVFFVTRKCWVSAKKLPATFTSKILCNVEC